MNQNIKRDKWYENRILWRAEQHKLFDKRCLRYVDAPEKVKEVIESCSKYKGIPVLLFFRNSELWTLLTTNEVVSFYDGKLRSGELDLVQKKVKIKRNGSNGSNQSNSVKESEFISLANLGVTVWAPAGSELFALMNILQMFPLNIK
ncbi:hypothetical protein [Synechococcus sp. PCC 7336]|uniref:hypothetical protein n=1 Tax=Synechococcus sp. PCC 7336 TaxID=195250 RepID=UPI000375909B|nr:hypothetical protein [Synechococcus sp. PCC 7336]